MFPSGKGGCCPTLQRSHERAASLAGERLGQTQSRLWPAGCRLLGTGFRGRASRTLPRTRQLHAGLGQGGCCLATGCKICRLGSSIDATSLQPGLPRVLLLGVWAAMKSCPGKRRDDSQANTTLLQLLTGSETPSFATGIFPVNRRKAPGSSCRCSGLLLHAADITRRPRAVLR